jgi:hypothetical protein
MRLTCIKYSDNLGFTVIAIIIIIIIIIINLFFLCSYSVCVIGHMAVLSAHL